ncbi:hypothetical protein KKA13_02355 [Patescibacteria group bacterium]|nr:hypothetical protein [Patescibacteria group bacterium]MBU1613131.1 hypothetical protein [Patescibacteria group bacterium]
MAIGEEVKKTINAEESPLENAPTEDLGVAETTEEEWIGEEGETEKPTAPRPEKQAAPKKQPPTPRKKPVIPQVKDPVTIKIEKIMEEDLKDFFTTLSPIAQQEFKIKGEETAYKIRDLLKASHVKVKNILRLIIEWLRMLPGINKFFLEQEAKIKTDKIILLSKRTEL